MTTPATAPDFTPEIVVQDGQPVTTSLVLAKVFEKQHLHVLRTIRTLEVPKEFIESNFGLVDYTDAKGEKRPMYHITRDGFTILAMGFTGKKAMEFKIRYIEAFNRMEETLRSQEPGRIEGKRLGTLSPIRQDLLRRAVVRKAEDAGVPPGKIWYRLMDAFRMPSHLHLAPEFFDQALLYLETLALPEGSRTKKLTGRNN
uniref:Phage regulatory protein, Rha family n=1 Tax=Leptospirillum ferrodiazotrophum TaxID=412449 RepID=C6HTZ1_9BACT|nr:MAG: Phage regulatory protein, Rha family [Leptospirillum ferrodiazotrophum]